jgi:hypothetical protein
MADIDFICDKFHSNLITFCDEMISLYGDSAFVVTRVMLPRISSQFIFGRINKVLPTLEKIVDTRDTSKYDSIKGQFGDMDLAINATISRIDGDTMSEDDKNVVWEWINSFVMFTKKYNELVAASS